MAKVKIHFVCQQCGHDSSQWLGKCPGCDAWNSMVEETVCKPETKTWHSTSEGAKPRPITEVDNLPVPRLATGVGEFDRVLGCGIVPGSLILIGGDPGIGKSTLLLQVACSVSQVYGAVLYISGEE